ncbi:MAG: DUF3461 family protein [Pseudomonadota bacterium]
MSKFPRLAEMGVLHPAQIARFSINSVDYVDYLRIIYDRPKGSLLPKIRNYEFPRVQKSLGPGGETAVMESSLELKEALEELRDVVNAKAQADDTASEMLDELKRLEETVAHHSACLRALAEKIREAQKKLV